MQIYHSFVHVNTILGKTAKTCIKAFMRITDLMNRSTEVSIFVSGFKLDVCCLLVLLHERNARMVDLVILRKQNLEVIFKNLWKISMHSTHLVFSRNIKVIVIKALFLH